MGKELELQGAKVSLVDVKDAEKSGSIIPTLSAMLQHDGGDRGQITVRADEDFVVIKYKDGTTRKDILSGRK